MTQMRLRWCHDSKESWHHYVYSVNSSPNPPRNRASPATITLYRPVTNEAYAAQIVRDWNVPCYGVGYVLRFAVDAAYASRFTVQNVGGPAHDELWVPAGELAEFNRHIVGPIA